MSSVKKVLIIEDDPTVRELLEIFLEDEGFLTAAAGNVAGAIQLVTSGASRPDLILADYNLHGSLNGLQLAVKLRVLQQRNTPAIILSGDISGGMQQEILAQNCIPVSKPMHFDQLAGLIQQCITNSTVELPG